MFIEQVIEFELTWSGSPAAHTPTRDKTKISMKYLRVDCLLFTDKILQEVMYLTSPIWAKSRTEFNHKMQNFTRVLDLNCK